MLSVGPATPGASAATANLAGSMTSIENAKTAAISMAFGIPSSSFMKITTTIPDQYLLLRTTKTITQSQ
jgi:hypothetical protein